MKCPSCSRQLKLTAKPSSNRVKCPCGATLLLRPNIQTSSTGETSKETDTKMRGRVSSNTIQNECSICGAMLSTGHSSCPACASVLRREIPPPLPKTTLLTNMPQDMSREGITIPEVARTADRMIEPLGDPSIWDELPPIAQEQSAHGFAPSLKDLSVLQTTTAQSVFVSPHSTVPSKEEEKQKRIGTVGIIARIISVPLVLLVVAGIGYALFVGTESFRRQWVAESAFRDLKSASIKYMIYIERGQERKAEAMEKELEHKYETLQVILQQMPEDEMAEFMQRLVEEGLMTP